MQKIEEREVKMYTTDDYIREKVKNITTYPRMNDRIKAMFSVQGSGYTDLYVVKRIIELEDEVNRLQKMIELE